MNADDFAADVLASVPRLTDPAGSSSEPMTVEEVRKLTPGDIEALREVEFAAWCAMVNENIDHYQQIADEMRSERDQFVARIEASRAGTRMEYPGVVQSMQGHIHAADSRLGVWEAMTVPDGRADLEALLATSEGADAYRWWRGRHCRTATPAARYYNHRVGDVLFLWMHLTSGGKHAPV